MVCNRKGITCTFSAPASVSLQSKKTESKRTARANWEQAERRGSRDIARKEPRKSKGHSSRGRSSRGRSSRTSRKAAEEEDIEGDAENYSSSEEEQPPVEASQQPPVDDEGEAILDASNVDLFQVPARRLAIGRKQALSDEDIEYLERAFKVDAKIEYLDQNPKRRNSDSWRRYAKYRSATTLREAKRLGASWSDILWDFERYYFSPVVGETSQTEAEGPIELREFQPFPPP